MDTGQIKDDFLREEIRQGYLVTSKMKRVWQIEIELAEYIISLCQRYGLQIWAEGGTLLGAIRHRGFIPWDDDIDLAMKRDDYEKLLDIASKEVKSPYFFQCVATDLDYIRGHAQLRKLNTSAVLPNNIKARFNQGIFIDIFVLDDVPLDGGTRNKLFERTQLMLNYLWTRRYLGKDSFNILRFLKYVIKLGKDSFRSDSQLFELFEAEFRNYHSETVALISFSPYVERWYREREWYTSIIYMKFEKMTIPVPVNYHEILLKQFGDYMTPVQAPSVHGDTIISINESYSQIIKSLRKPLLMRLLMKFYSSLKIK